MKQLQTVAILLLVLVAVGCANEPEADIEATVAAALAATQTAAPTAMPLPPTATPVPTETPAPTETPTPAPTETPIPEPTATPLPVTEPVQSESIIESELDDGSTLYELPVEGFSIALPEDWQAIDLNEINLGEIIGAVGEQNESLQDLFSSGFFQNLIAAGIKFYAINLSAESLQAATPPTINILVQELPFEATLEMYTTLNITQLEQFFDLTSEIEQTPITLGDLEGTQITYSTNIVDAVGRPIEIVNRQYLMLDGSLAYIVTVSMPIAMAEDYLEPFSEAAETFRLIK